MEWFKKVKTGLKAQEKRPIPDGVWVKCDTCGEIIYKKELIQNLWVCAKCGFHFRIKSGDYVRILLDDGTFDELHSNITAVDSLKFRDSKKYTDRVKDAMKKTGLSEAARTGIGKVDGKSIVLGILAFDFLGGSMGSVVGEKIARATEQALRDKIPLIVVSSSGGARMQEGALSLMQMAKTSARLAQLSEASVPYISVLTHPTTGGVAASFAMLGDIIIAEPGALIGFAGPRVIEQTIGQELPEGFQRSEFLLEHGFIDVIVNRRELKPIISTLLDHLT
ncbi:MAG: acetyl-CoA carboxylase carboxyltransferase subunit beta [Gemmatimonadota bacterium]|nr:MAG: acetyl-CoA carboxylase carboxyltransferase subunit beta [Gemmatimonadota bacterium]